jgi:TorA maturation chaperone TorD
MAVSAFRDRLVLSAVREAVAEDVALLASLHERCPDASVVAMIQASRFPLGLGLSLRGQPGRTALAAMANAVTGLTLAPARLKQLAADHASQSSDIDDLVVRLAVVGQLIGTGDGRAELCEAARYLDIHVMDRLGGYADKAAARCREPLYPALAQLLAAYTRELRELLRDILDQQRPAFVDAPPLAERVGCS